MAPHRPRVDPDSLVALFEAIELLAILRGTCCPINDPDDVHDPADALTLAWSLSLQIDAYLPELIADAHHHGYSWTHIRDLFDPAPTQRPSPRCVTHPCPSSDTEPDATRDNNRG